MAQTNYINIMLDGSAATSSDPGKWKHGVIGGASGLGAATFSWDPALLNNANVANSVFDFLRQRVVGGGSLK